MNGEDGQAFLVQNMDPEDSQREIDEGKQEINPGEGGFTGGEIIPAVGVGTGLQIVHGGVDFHGDAEVGEAAGEDERVLIRDGDVVGFREGNRGIREGVEGEDEIDGVGLEGAGDLGVVDLVEDVKPGIASAEEETEAGEVEGGGVGGEGDGGDPEFETAPVSEAELVQGDDATCIVANLGGSNFSDYECRRNEEEEKKKKKDINVDGVDHLHLHLHHHHRKTEESSDLPLPSLPFPSSTLDRHHSASGRSGAIFFFLFN